MNTLINSSGYLSSEQPYNAFPWYYQGQEQLASVPADMVDWILVELRDHQNMVLARRAALLMSNGNILDTYGWILSKKKEYKEALTHLNKAKTLLPKNSGILYHLGVVYYDSGNKSAAIKSLKKVISISQNQNEIKKAKKLLKEVEG